MEERPRSDPNVLEEQRHIWLKTEEGVVVPSPWQGWDQRVPLAV